MKKKVISAVKPTGNLHLGNYFGAIKQFIDLQDKFDCMYFIADYHALNGVPAKEQLEARTLDILMNYLSLGIDPNKSVIFLQSAVPEVLELEWILASFTNVSLLNRAHAYKDSVEKGFNANTGLFCYPVLMAADILLYDGDLVPVGKDQKQHMEICKDIATKFNAYSQGGLKVPEAYILEKIATVPGTDGQKMSKSYNNVVSLFGTPKEIKKQVMNIITDSTPLEAPKNPDTCNVFSIYKLFTTKEEQNALAEKYRAGNFGYGDAKKILLEKILEYFHDAQEKKAYYLAHKDEAIDIIKAGNATAREIAKAKIEDIRSRVGLVTF